MLSIFTPREIASSFWLLTTVICLICWRKTRPALFTVVKTACSPQLSIPFVFMLLYASLLVCILTSFTFWKWSYLKDIAFWILFVGVPVCYRTVDKTLEQHFFRKMIFDNLALSVLLVFLVSSFTYSLIIELILIPFVTFLVVLSTVASKSPQFLPVKRVCDFLIFVIGLFNVISSINLAIESIKVNGSIDILVTFCIPLVFSILYIPIAFSFGLYARSQALFIRMSFRESKNRKIIRHNHFAVLMACKLSYQKLLVFQMRYMSRMYVTMSKDYFDDLILRLKTNSD